MLIPADIAAVHLPVQISPRQQMSCSANRADLGVLRNPTPSFRPEALTSVPALLRCRRRWDLGREDWDPRPGLRRPGARASAIGDHGFVPLMIDMASLLYLR